MFLSAKRGELDRKYKFGSVAVNEIDVGREGGVMGPYIAFLSVRQPQIMIGDQNQPFLKVDEWFCFFFFCMFWFGYVNYYFGK